MATILVVDDEPRIRDVVQYALEREGFQVLLAADGNEALDKMKSATVDLVVLDILMPELDGLSVCRAIRKESAVPIIFLSSRAEEVDRILGLELGGDDYVTKPFSPRELAIRVKTVLRRTGAPGSGTEPVGPRETLMHGPIEVNLAKHEVRVKGDKITLTVTEFGVLHALVERPGRLLTRTQLIERALRSRQPHHRADHRYPHPSHSREDAALRHRSDRDGARSRLQGQRDRGRVMRRLLRWLINELFRIRTRLLLVNVLIAAVPIVGISFARFYEREMLRSLETDMINQAEILRQMLSVDPRGVGFEGLGPVLAESAKETRTRIRVLGTDGQLLADSHAKGPPEGPEKPAPSLLPTRSRQTWRVPDPPEQVDVADRSEVRAALAGRYGATTRFWENRDRLYLFSAMPVMRDGKVAGVVYVTRSTNPVRAAMYRLRTSLLMILLAAVSVTVVLSVFLASTISRPLTHLTRVADRIARGDRSQRLKLARRDEIGQLARAFDAMTNKLDERARYIGQLAANISHEFKSPLTGIRGAAELLEEGAADDPAARARFLGNIQVDANRLDRLVTRLLELARFEADPVPGEMIDYEALVREVSERAPGTAAVRVKYHAKRTQLLGKRAHLASALGNLIDNAQQHAEQGTEVEVRVSDASTGGIRTCVHNQGSVISEAHLKRIWDRFFTTRAECGGTGLGLPIVVTVIEAHGGSVTVSSTEELGTTFCFDLPVPK